MGRITVDLVGQVDRLTTGTTAGSVAENLVAKDKNKGEGSLTEEFLDGNVGERV